MGSARGWFRARRAAVGASLALAAVVASPLKAQLVLPASGQRVRVTVRGDSAAGSERGVIGRLVEIERDTVLLIVRDADRFPIPLGQVVTMDASVSRRSRTTILNTTMPIGMSVGLVGGVVVGAAIGARNDPIGWGGVLGAFVGAIIGTGAGAVSGYLVGAEAELEQWRPLDVPPPGTVIRRAVPSILDDVRPAATRRDEALAAMRLRLPVGARIRVIRRSDGPDVDGTVLALDTVIAIRRASGDSVAVPWADVLRLGRFVPKSSARAAGRGAVTGAVAGAVIGFQYLNMVKGCTSFGDPSAPVLTDCDDRAIGQTVAVAAVAGAGLGAFIGRVRNSSGGAWAEVLLEPAFQEVLSLRLVQ
jgi:hypothetical protein